MSTEREVRELLEPVVATLDIELLEVELNGATLRVTVDDPSSDGITSGQLADVNRLVSPVLDLHDPIAGRYTLEVTSPGLERPLKRLEHYTRAIGEDIVVKMVPNMEPRRVKGRLVSVDESAADAAVVDIDVNEVDGTALPESDLRSLRLADIASARTIFEWGPTPKPGQPKNKNQQNKKKQPNKKQPRGAR